jgi:uncharacterized protein (TIGR02246 family)
MAIPASSFHYRFVSQLIYVSLKYNKMKLPEKPEQVHAALAAAWNTGDVNNVLALYEDEGVLVPQPGLSISGKTKIREALLGFLSTKGIFEIKTTYCIQCGDVAMSRSIWSIRDGDEIKIQAKGTELLRKQPGGSWLFAVDHPFGADEYPLSNN